MPLSRAGQKRKLVYPAVKLESSRWPVALIREGLAAYDKDGQEHANWLASETFATGRDLFVANLGRQVCAVAVIDRMTGGDAGASLRLAVAAVLAGIAGDADAFKELRDATWRAEEDNDVVPPGTLGNWLGKRLDNTGRILLGARLNDADPLLDGPYHRVLMAIERRLCDRIAVDLYARALDVARVDVLAARARAEKMAFVEAVIGLAWADGHPDRREKDLLAALVGIGRFETGERTMLRAAMNRGGVSVARIADDIHNHDDALRLLETLTLAAFIDGEFSADERRYIDDIAERLGIDEKDTAAIDQRVSAALADDPSLLAGVRATARIGRTVRSRQTAIESLVRRNIDAIGNELLQTGDLVFLLAKSVRQPLNPAENKRMKSQLVDLCRAVPALALFAAPGGTLLLPILARTLPFSIAPSSFRDADEDVF